MARAAVSHHREVAKPWKQFLSSSSLLLSLPISFEAVWRKSVGVLGWLRSCRSYSQPFISGLLLDFFVGLHPVWQRWRVGWSPAHFAARSSRLQGKETFFCLSSRWICSEDSLWGSAAVAAVLAVHSLQSWSRWKEAERRKEFLEGGGKYCDFLLCCFLGVFPVRVRPSK